MTTIFQPAHSDQLLNYFSSYLLDTSTIISQLKTMVYSLINIAHPPPKNTNINPDIHSIMTACKRSYDDLKRTQSILRGHVKGKSNQHSTVRFSPSLSKKNIQNTSVVSRIKRQETRLKDTWQPSTEVNIESESQASRCVFVTTKIEETKESRVTLFPIPTEPYGQSCVSIFEADRKSQPVDKEGQFSRIDKEKQQDLQERINKLRESRRKDLQSFSQGNTECLSLIKRIRDELKLKKKRKA